MRIAFNPNITTAWFTSVMGIINSISMLAIILAGAAIVREREHGTMDHLLVMPLTPFEIAMSKVWANALVITVAVGLSLYVVVRTILGIPIAGSIPLFMVGVVIYLFFATAIGIFLGTVARSMPQRNSQAPMPVAVGHLEGRLHEPGDKLGGLRRLRQALFTRTGLG